MRGTPCSRARRLSLAVAGAVAAQEVLLQFHVHRAAAVPRQVIAQQARGLPAAAFLHQVRQAPAAPAAQQHDALGVRRQVLGVEARRAAVDGAGQGEQARDMGVTLAGLGEQRQARAVLQGELAAGDGLDAQGIGQAGEFEGAAQVGVGQSQGAAAVRLGLRQQFVDVRGAETEREKTLGVQFDVRGTHGSCSYALCRYQPLSRWLRNTVSCLPSPEFTR